MQQATAFEWDVFISYSGQDREWVREELLKELEGAGLRTFVDFRDFEPGAPSIKEMERGIAKSRKTLLVLTPAYIESEWCEIETVMLQTLSPANRDLRLIPLLKVACEKPLRIGALTHIDFTDEADPELAWRRLLATLEVTSEHIDPNKLPTEIQAELNKADSLLKEDKHSEAIPILQHGLAVADRLNHSVARVQVRLRLAHALYDASEDFAGAERQYRDALTLVPVSNSDLKRRVLHGLGEMLLLAGRVDEAKAASTALAQLTRQSGKKDELAWSLMLEAHVDQTLGFHQKAAAALDEAIRLLFELSLSLDGEEKRHNASAVAICYLNKAAMSREDGNTDEALAFCEAAEEQHRMSGDKLNAGKALVFRGELHCANADWQKGFECYRQAMEQFREISNPLWTARTAERISRLHETHEYWQEAVEAMLAAAAGAEDSSHAGEQVHFLCEAANLLRRWKVKGAKDDAWRKIRELAKNVPEAEQADFYAEWSGRMSKTNEAIGSCRSEIERELQASQAPTQTLRQLLESLGMLLAYRPDRATAYLPFWYFAMQSELLAALRSGPLLSLMVVTDDVERFIGFAGAFRHMADHFVMATTVQPTVKIEPSVLAIPPKWLFPPTFTFVLMKKRDPGGEATDEAEEAHDSPPPRVRIAGPANSLPAFMPVDHKSDVKGEGHMMGLWTWFLPQQAIDLMGRHPIEDLIAHRAVWLPTLRHGSKDPFLTDLRVGYERGLFPVYFDHFPASDATAISAAIRIAVPRHVLNGESPVEGERWRRAMLKMTKLQKDKAKVALLDLPELFLRGENDEVGTVHVEVALFEFAEIDERVLHPAIVIKTAESE